MKLEFKKVLFLTIGILSIIVLLKYDIGIPCFINLITGLYCPGCGGTRAIKSLLRLDILQAFRYNSLIITILPFAILYIIYKYIFNGKKKVPDWVWISLLIIAMIFGIIRNIPLFHFLAPIKIIN